jgi:very-short-patch-repair endonuclease
MDFIKNPSDSKHNLGASKIIKGKAKELRKNLTRSEEILWSCLRGRKQKKMYFRRQHPYGIYILDFYCFKANLAIEVDGGIHLNQVEYDDERTKYLESSGLTVLRFNNQDVEKIFNWYLTKSINILSTILKITHAKIVKLSFPLWGKQERG